MGQLTKSTFTVFLCVHLTSRTVFAFEVPFADRLQKIISNTIFRNYTFDTGNIFGYLRGENVSALKEEEPDSLRVLGEDLEINTLDTDLLHKILRAAWREEVDSTKSLLNVTQSLRNVTPAFGNVTNLGNATQTFGNMTRLNARRFRVRKPYPEVDYEYYLRLQPHDQEVRQMLMDLMKQSIYDVRYRMQRTIVVRDRIDGSFDYRIGVLCGAISELVIKLQSLYETVKHFNINRAKMIYYLIAYERYLAIYIDIITTSKTVYLFHTQWRERIIKLEADFIAAENAIKEHNTTGSSAGTSSAGATTAAPTAAATSLPTLLPNSGRP